MRKLVLLMHVSLDGFVAGPNGEMDWIKLDPAMFDFVGELTAGADIAMYGRRTFELMDSYWPTAGSKPDASKHDKEHSEWYNKVTKIVVSRTLDEKKLKNVKVISDPLAARINAFKKDGDKSIMMFGSASVSHSLTAQGLIDDYWVLINPVLLGKGIPLFKGIADRINLKLKETKTFGEVTALHYTTI